MTSNEIEEIEQEQVNLKIMQNKFWTNANNIKLKYSDILIDKLNEMNEIIRKLEPLHYNRPGYYASEKDSINHAIKNLDLVRNNIESYKSECYNNNAFLMKR